MRKKGVLFLGLAALLIAGVFLFTSRSPGPSSNAQAYDRVIKTNELRCAYAPYPLFFEKDPQTGVLRGAMVDIMREIEKTTGVTVVWGPEVDFGSIAANLKAGKADAFCSGMVLTPRRGRVLAGTTPLFFGVVEAYARKDDTRFDNAIQEINTSSIRVAVNEGDFSEEIAKRFFPKATRVYKGPLGGEDQLFMDVAAKKADVTFSGPSHLVRFNAHNKAQALRQVPLPRFLYTIPAVIAVDIGEGQLQRMLDTAVHDLIDNGLADKILRKWTGMEYGMAYFPAKQRL